MIDIGFATTACSTALIAALIAPQADPQSAAPPERAATAPQAAPETEIVVTARRREENLQEVPLSITALASETIDRRGVGGVGDVARLTPGLQFDRGATPGDLRPSLRGIPLIEGRSNVALLVDGIDVTGISLDSQFGGAGSQLALGLLDLERIEVVKGPQSVFFGRSAFAGAINFVGREPGNTFEAKLVGALGDYGRRELSAHVTLPIVTDILSVKVSGTTREFDGFYRNPGNDLKLGSENSQGGGATIVFTPGDRFKARAQVQYIDQEFGHPAGYSQPRADVTLTGVNFIDRRSFDPRRIGISTIIPYKGNQSDTYRGLLSLSYEATDDITFSSLTGYNKVTGINEFDFDQKAQDVPSGVPAAGGRSNCQPRVCVGIFDYDIDLRQFSQEARIAYDRDTLHLMVGGYYFNERYRQNEFNRFIGALPFVGPTRNGITPRLFGQNTETKAAFGSIEYAPIDGLKLGAEVRYSRESVEGFGANFTPILQSGSTAEAFRDTLNFASWTPRFSIAYDVDRDRHVYASAARGTKPGGLNLGQVVDSVRGFGQEKIWTYEAGIKADFLDRKLQVNLAAYYSDWRDVQVTTVCFGANSPRGPEPQCPDFAATSLNYIINAERAAIKGIDLDVRAQLTPVLTASASYAYADSTFKDFVARDPYPGLGTTRQYAGNRLPLIPRHSLVGTVRFAHPLPGRESVSFFTEGSVRYRSSRFSRFDNRVKLAAKTVGDVQLGFEQGDFSILLFVDNVFDDTTPDFTRYFPIFNPSSPNGEYIGAPDRRAFGIRTRMTLH